MTTSCTAAGLFKLEYLMLISNPATTEEGTMEKLSRDCASLFILGIICILISILLAYGLIGQRYYVDIDTFSIVYSLSGGNYVVTLIGGILLPVFVFGIGLALIGCIFE